MTDSCRILVSGRVQGVFYRESARKKAVELDLKGYVRNLRDGNVEVVVQGNKLQVNKFIEWCRTGPKLATVSKIETEEVLIDELPNFSVRTSKGWFS